MVVCFEEETDDREDHDGEGRHDDAVGVVRTELYGRIEIRTMTRPA